MAKENEVVRLMKQNMSKKTIQITSACEISSDFTSGGFSTIITINHLEGKPLKETLILTLHEIKDLKDFLETLL